jgi:hypothetical protein
MAGSSVDELLAPEQTGFAVYTAPADTDLPDDIADPFEDPWLLLGYIPESGFTITVNRETVSYRVMQLIFAARKRAKAQELEIGLALSQWGNDQFDFVFGGGTFEALASGVRYKLPLTSPGSKALALEVVDGDNVFRFGFLRGLVTGNTQIGFGQDNLAEFPVTFSPEPDDNGDLGNWDTNAPGFEADIS